MVAFVRPSLRLVRRTRGFSRPSVSSQVRALANSGSNLSGSDERGGLSHKDLLERVASTQKRKAEELAQREVAESRGKALMDGAPTAGDKGRLNRSTYDLSGSKLKYPAMLVDQTCVKNVGFDADGSDVWDAAPYADALNLYLRSRGIKRALLPRIPRPEVEGQLKEMQNEVEEATLSLFLSSFDVGWDVILDNAGKYPSPVDIIEAASRLGLKANPQRLIVLAGDEAMVEAARDAHCLVVFAAVPPIGDKKEKRRLWKAARRSQYQIKNDLRDIQGIVEELNGISFRTTMV